MNRLFLIPILFLSFSACDVGGDGGDAAGDNSDISSDAVDEAVTPVAGNVQTTCGDFIVNINGMEPEEVDEALERKLRAIEQLGLRVAKVTDLGKEIVINGCGSTSVEDNDTVTTTTDLDVTETDN